jgi:hypothetical protein
MHRDKALAEVQQVAAMQGRIAELKQIKTVVFWVRGGYLRTVIRAVCVIVAERCHLLHISAPLYRYSTDLLLFPVCTSGCSSITTDTFTPSRPHCLIARRCIAVSS